MKELLVNIWTECCTCCNYNSPNVVEGRHEYANWFLRRGEYSSFCLHRRIWFQNLDGQKSRTGSRWTACMLIAKCVDRRDATLQFAWRCLKFSVWCITPFQWVGWSENPSQSVSQVLLPSLMKMKLIISFSMGHQHIDDSSSQETTQICVYCHHTHYF